MKTFLTIAMSLVFATVAVHAQTTNLNQNFDSFAPPASPSAGAAAIRTFSVLTAQTNIVAGDSSSVAGWMFKTNTQSAYLEYNAPASSNVGSMYISFDLANNAPSATITQQMTFGVGANGPLGSSTLNSSANRFFAMDFYQGLRNDMTLRGSGNLSLTTGVAYAANYQNVQIWANDNDTTSISYIRPDNLAVATLGPNSVVYWLNNALVLAETDSGYAYTNAPNGNANWGRVGFTVTSANQANFLIDNLLVTDVAQVIPEPSTCALVGFAGLLLVWARRRQAR